MILQIFDIDSTLAKDDSDDALLMSCYPNVLSRIKSLDLTRNKLIFLTARWQEWLLETHIWLVKHLDHDNFSLCCRPILYPRISDIAAFKLDKIKELIALHSPEEVHFYDDCSGNLWTVHRNLPDVRLYRAFDGELLAFGDQ